MDIREALNCLHCTGCIRCCYCYTTGSMRGAFIASQARSGCPTPDLTLNRCQRHSGPPDALQPYSLADLRLRLAQDRPWLRSDAP